MQKIHMLKKSLICLMNVFFVAICLIFLFLSVCYCLGFCPYIVQSGSMEPKIQTGGLVFIDKNYEYDELEVGNIIAFEPKSDTLVIHRIINIDGSFIETKGDNNDVSDGFSTNERNYKGLLRFYIPKAGYALAWLKTKRGLIISITFIVAFIILDSLLHVNEKGNKKSLQAKQHIIN